MQEGSIDSLLAAWQTLSDSPDPSTLMGLRRVLEEFSRENSSEGRVELVERGLATLSSSLQRALAETHQDQSRLPETSPLQDILQSAADAYEGALELVEDMESGELPWREDPEEALEELDEILMALRDSQAQWRTWLNAPTARCAKCGHADDRETHCPQCACDLLLPDRREARVGRSRQAVLGSDFKRAYDLYLNLQDGSALLSHLVEALAPVEKEARVWSVLLQADTNGEIPESVRNVLAPSSLEILGGAQQIREALDTREWAHIHDGWDRIFHSAADIQSVLPELHRCAGDHEEASRLERAYAQRDMV